VRANDGQYPSGQSHLAKLGVRGSCRAGLFDRAWARQEPRTPKCDRPAVSFHSAPYPALCISSSGILNLMSEVAIRLHLEPLEEGGYVATSPDVPGLVAEGRSIVEATEIAQGLARKIVESCIDHGDVVPGALIQLTAKSPE